MASISILIKTIKDPVNLYIRFNININGKTRDLFSKTNIFIKRKWWSNKKQSFNSVTEKFPKEDLRLQINKLKDFVMLEFNECYSAGETIDKIWLSETVKKFNNQSRDDDSNFAVYFVEFVKKFIEESEGRINTDTGRVISTKTIQKYGTTLLRLQEFENKTGRRLRHKDINLEFHSAFVKYLKIDCNYGNSTTNKYISQIKMFCKKAEVKGYPVSPEYKSDEFSFKRQKPLDPYLNEIEIDSIYKLDIEDDELDKMRDLFIIGLHTGLRVSDLKDLNRLSIVGNNIKIASTQKTTKPAEIPIHHYVRSILNKRNGNLPLFNLTPQSLEIKFNEKIKEICLKAGIKERILGDKMDKETKRSVRKLYPKYELISSHICRRSFVTNHYGKISNQAIMAITTHASEAQLLEYVKTSNEDHIEAMRQLWESQKNSKLSIA